MFRILRYDLSHRQHSIFIVSVVLRGKRTFPRRRVVAVWDPKRTWAVASFGPH
jgi:hypothetical protein